MCTPHSLAYIGRVGWNKDLAGEPNDSVVDDVEITTQEVDG